MKKVAVLLPAMRIGGAEKIFLNFLPYLMKRYDITLILNRIEGELLKLLPKELKILEDPLWDFMQIVKFDLSRFNIIGLLKDLKYYVTFKKKGNLENNYRYLIKRSPSLKNKYDVAISYVANVSTQVFCLSDRIDAKIKIAWIHGETTQIYDTKLFDGIYATFNRIFCVSKVTKEHFIGRFNSCCENTDIYYNPINKDSIIKKSIEPYKKIFSENLCNILTVGRFSPEKGLDMIPPIIKILQNKKYHVLWTIIGDGPQYNDIVESAVNLGVIDSIVFLGAVLNPYPYIKNCDIYIQPSYEEGYSTTICEAGILGKAIIGTKTSGGIREQITDNESGMLANPNPEDLAEKIIYLIDKPEQKRKIENEVLQIDFSNRNEIIKLERIINES